MRQCWLVIGERGEFDEYHEWIVAVYLDYELACMHVAQAEVAKRRVPHYGDRGDEEQIEFWTNFLWDQTQTLKEGCDLFDLPRWRVEQSWLPDHPDQYVEELTKQ